MSDDDDDDDDVDGMGGDDCMNYTPSGIGQRIKCRALTF
jgi:hypothetical protein